MVRFSHKGTYSVPLPHKQPCTIRNSTIDVTASTTRLLNAHLEAKNLTRPRDVQGRYVPITSLYLILKP